MTVHTIDPRKRDERTERRQLYHTIQELTGVTNALRELAQVYHGPQYMLLALVEFQRLQIRELQRLIELAHGTFEDDIPF